MMQPRTIARLTLTLTLAGGLPAAPSDAQTPLKADTVVTGASLVTWVGAPPGDGRIFVMEQLTDRIEVFQDPPGAPTEFLNLATAGGATGSGERGSLGMVFHPDYGQNGHFFVYYTFGANGSRIERYTVSANPDVADPTSGVTVLEVTQPFSNHNGGQLQFGPMDGLLYFGFGDGGSACDPGCRSQKMDTLHGKMLRIDVSTLSLGFDYSIPAGNPFIGTPGALPEIFHLGLRNPWRWHFDPANGDMYIGDVGQDREEEVSFAQFGDSGLNFGWDIKEGNACGTCSLGGCPVGLPSCGALTDPIHTFNHTAGFPSPCSVIGGPVYRGCAIPDLQGTYFFADLCDDKVWSFRYDGATQTMTDFTERTAELMPAHNGVRTFGVDGNGEILLANSNTVYRIAAASPPLGFFDCDGNGQDDACEIAAAAHKDLDGDGGLDACQGLSADSGEFSITAGGAQTMFLHPGAGRAGDFFFLGGSISGTGPTTIGAVSVPITFDAYTNHAIANPNSIPLTANFGLLDGNGEATSPFTAGPGVLPGGLVGLTVYHAFVTLGGGGVPDLASNFVKVDLLP